VTVYCFSIATLVAWTRLSVYLQYNAYLVVEMVLDTEVSGTVCSFIPIQKNTDLCNK
jgi:hypothetical protein